LKDLNYNLIISILNVEVYLRIHLFLMMSTVKNAKALTNQYYVINVYL